MPASFLLSDEEKINLSIYILVNPQSLFLHNHCQAHIKEFELLNL
jgi:hypothetical protein